MIEKAKGNNKQPLRKFSLKVYKYILQFTICWSSGKMKEPFVGIERRKSAAASPTKRIERNRIFELQLTKE
jgi:hypothetical protein